MKKGGCESAFFVLLDFHELQCLHAVFGTVADKVGAVAVAAGADPHLRIFHGAVPHHPPDGIRDDNFTAQIRGILIAQHYIILRRIGLQGERGAFRFLDLNWSITIQFASGRFMLHEGKRIILVQTKHEGEIRYISFQIHNIP